MTQHILDQAIITSLEPLFEEARAKGLWFYHDSPGYDQIWCSPENLRKQQAEGKMIWAPEHWELRNPVGYMTKLAADANAIVDEYNELAKLLRIEETLELIAHSSNPADRR